MSQCQFCDQAIPQGAVMCPKCGAAAGEQDDATGLPADFEDRIATVLKQSGTIQAIKVYREFTHVGLAEAKAAVEAIGRGGHSSATATSGAAAVTGNLEQELIALVGRGEKIMAIKRYREATGAGLKEAKDAVEALPIVARDILPTRGGCLGLVLAGVFLAALAGKLLAGS